MRSSLITWITSLLCGAGCATSTAQLRPLPARSDHGDQIYRGASFAPDGAQAFRYTRYSKRTASGLLSTHVTRTHGTDETAVVQQGSHDGSYALNGFRESHLQSRIEASGTRLPDGGMRFVREHKGRRRVRVESAGAPFVVGPTLFGFVCSRWDTLAAGEAVDVRFVVAERARSYGFTLRRGSSTAEHTVIEMRAKRPLVRAMVPPMRMRFETATCRIDTYDGRIPPRYENKPLDAHVTYEHTAAAYR